MLDLFPYILLAAAGFIVFCAGAFRRSESYLPLFMASIVAAAGAGIDAAVVQPSGSNFGPWLDLGVSARYFTVLLSAVTVITLLFAHQYSRLKGFSIDEFYGLVLYAALGMMLTANALNWLVFFVGLELLSVSLYVIIAVRKDVPISGEAGIKYFIVGAVAGSFLVFGIAVLYAVTGAMDIAASLAADAGAHPGILLGFGLILVGVGFKISLIPFHLWTPDVYQGAPAPVTAFLAAGSKVAVFGALLRFALASGDALWAYVMPVFWLFAVLNMVVGNVSALSQHRLKRLLAYSSIAQIGYLMMALVVVKQNGTFAVLFYLTVYALMDLGAFGFVGLMSAEKTDLDRLADCEGLGYSHPWQAGLLAVCLLSLAGLPPTAGFMGKFLIFKAVVQEHHIVLGIVGILTVILSIYYYLKVLVALYMRPAEHLLLPPQLDLGGRLAIFSVLLPILALGIAPAAFLHILDPNIRVFPFPGLNWKAL